ncbi:GNAT family N-acetyltransferase [Pseudomonas alkylphenolica]|uniref:GNAT family N-acetyltransferase n=1 Tax=Pseudomonas alkylphenolica TaxID=237609 RepID=UPI0018D7BC90|nr:GNAT family N-acetyltransferase [Pseudomonas alkylphenolica]MBH3429600.1 GNAT family N-acetyltransferase [Pseudomonas alkylphenolica]
MTLLRYGPLTALEQPLLNKFYKSQGSPMRAPAQGQLWVARAEEIVAGLSLSPVPGGYWLTGLWVAKNRRGQKIAGALIETALQSAEGTTWLFCHPDLQVFYQQQGFSTCTRLPAVLAERLARYQHSKPLLAMARVQSSLPASSPGNNTSV